MPFNNNYKKAITFSFDDGNIDDVRLIEILNKYNLKATFNLNSSMLADNFIWNYDGVKEVHHINFSEHPRLYDGHEVASHTVRHPHLESLSYLAKKNEIQLDQIYLKALYGYDICGMALPFGSYDDEVVKVLKELNILYCRTTKSTYKFNIPDCLPLLHPTCHFRYKDLDKLTDEFLNAQNDGDMLFYIWGHSYELVTEEDWQKFEEFCSKISNRDDIYYCTNKEAILNHTNL